MEKLEPRTVSQSAINDWVQSLFPGDLNPLGIAFGGRVIEMADELAGIIAIRHSGSVCVTLSIDSVRFYTPVRQNELLIFKAAVNRVWKTSMEVGIKVFVHDVLSDKQRHGVSAYFTLVAIDENQKPIPVRPVIPETEDEKRRYEEAEQRRKYRLSLDNKKQAHINPVI